MSINQFFHFHQSTRYECVLYGMSYVARGLQKPNLIELRGTVLTQRFREHWDIYIGKCKNKEEKKTKCTIGEQHWNDTTCMHLYLHSKAIVFQKLIKILTSILLQESQRYIFQADLLSELQSPSCSPLVKTRQIANTPATIIITIIILNDHRHHDCHHHHHDHGHHTRPLVIISSLAHGRSPTDFFSSFSASPRTNYFPHIL